jgi:3-phenylpropionate/cinnamic acid dioxygenase small subunit
MSDFAFRKPGVVDADQAFLSARAAIADVISAYSYFFDSGDFKALADLFTEEATFHMNPTPDGFPEKISGREEIASSLAMLWNHNRTEARSLLTATLAYEDGRHELRRTGTYVDLLHSDAGRWRLAARRLYFLEAPGLADQV